MKTRFLTTMAMAMMSSMLFAQRDNLYVRNDSDPIYGCTYYVTPIAELSLLGIAITVYGLERPFDPSEEYTYTSSQLLGALGVGYKYIGAKVDAYNADALKVYKSPHAGYQPEDSQPEGDCTGGQIDAYYDPDYVANTTGEVYITDEQ